MTFTSLEFLFLFLPAFLLLYLVIPKTWWRNSVLFVASIAFYSWGEPVLVALMLGSVALTYVLGLVLDARQEKGWRRGWLIVALVANVGMLAVFKYTGFAFTIAASLSHAPLVAPKVPLPLGVSFYTFQALAYLIDLYRGSYRAERNPIKLTIVIASFATITAGPIIRFVDMKSQVDARTVGFNDAVSGLRRVVIGVSKKVLIANSVAFVATQILSHRPDQYGFVGAWIGALAWTMQIYFDFSGYSDIAIGIGKMMGFTYRENFNYPYVAQSAQDFWRRWHMSLSSFFRDYVYIPLGGSRVSTARWVFNMAVVWTLTGVWHGANWTYIAWGVYYGVLLVLEKLVYGNLLQKAPRFVRHVYALLVIVCGWVLFMSPTFADAADVLRAMIGLSGTGTLSNFVMMRVVQPTYIAAMLAAVLGSMPWWKGIWAKTGENAVLGIAVDVFLIVAFAASCVMLVVGTFTPFIYLKF